MPKVYISSEQPHLRYEPAQRFGSEIIPVAGGNWSTVRSSISNEQTMRRIEDVLRHFDAGDFLIISGSPVVTALCVLYLSRRFTDINVLVWDKAAGEYAESVLDLTIGE